MATTVIRRTFKGQSVAEVLEQVAEFRAVCNEFFLTLNEDEVYIVAYDEADDTIDEAGGLVPVGYIGNLSMSGEGA